MGPNIYTSLLIFGLIWWVVIFTILPRDISSQLDDGDIAEGSEPGAPSKPQLKRKLVMTTIISLAIFIVIYLFLASGLLKW